MVSNEIGSPANKTCAQPESEIEDQFRWLEDQDSPATRRFIKVHKEKYDRYLNLHNDLRDRIGHRVTELLAVETIDLPVPDKRGGVFYLKREACAQQKSIYHRDPNGTEKLFLSPTRFDTDVPASLAIIQLSPSGKTLIFGVRNGGGDAQTLNFLNALTGELLPDHLPLGLYRGVAIDRQDLNVYYSNEDTQGQYQLRKAVRKHSFGKDLSEDSEVYCEGEGPGLRLIVQEVDEGESVAYLISYLDSALNMRFLLQHLPVVSPPSPIVMAEGYSFSPCAIESGIVEAITTYQSPNGRVVRFRATNPAIQFWEDVIPESRKEQLEGYQRVGQLCICHYQANGQFMSRIYDYSNTLVREIEYPPSGTTALGTVDEVEGRLYYLHSDVDSPPSIHTVDINTGVHRVWWKRSSPTPPQSVEIEHLKYVSADGNEIPVTVMRKCGRPRCGPVLLSAYGSGSSANTPKFSALQNVLLEEGVSCAFAHVRGGGDYGVDWHQAATKAKKQISVEDLLCAAEGLFRSGYVDNGRLALAGQSIGALLVLCGMTQRPWLFRAVLALGPITDLTRFHLFGVARGFVVELGSPDDPDELRALHQLSPYHQVRNEEQYPAVLIISGDCDRRCDALHARKMTARLEQADKTLHPVLLDYNSVRGHKPVMPLSERISALTHRLTFLLAELRDESVRGDNR